eukprot:765831-Hanusia_phi.AAC.2
MRREEEGGGEGLWGSDEEPMRQAIRPEETRGGEKDKAENQGKRRELSAGGRPNDERRRVDLGSSK